MPITTDAIENGHIHSLKFISTWTVEDLVKAENWDRDLRDKCGYHRVHTLVDVSVMRGMPPNVIAISRRTPALTHPTAGDIALCGAGAFTQSIANTIFKLARFNRVKFCETYEEGLAHLKSVVQNEDSSPSSA